MKKFAFALLCAFVASVFALPAFAADPAEGKKPNLDAQFKKLDKDGNKELSEDEFCASRKTDKAKEQAKKQFARLDKDSSKSLSLEEFKTRTPKKPKTKTE